MKPVSNASPAKKLAALALALVLFFAASLPGLAPRAGAIDDPAITTAAAYLWDLDARQVLYAKNPAERRAPASLTKIMTALLAVEAYENGEIGLSDKITVTDDPYFDITPDGSSAGIKVGEELTFEQLLYCSLLASANEGCNVLAQVLAGDVTSFVERMNTRAAELGCTDTHFANTHGMPDETHYSTAEDLCRIAEEALKHNLLKRVVSTPTYTVPATNMSNERVLKNTNNLIQPSSPEYYEYAAGMKTGHTNAAGYCLIAYATKDGRQLLSVVLGGESAVLDSGRTVPTSFTETKRLLEWGFDNFSYQEILSTAPLAEIPVALGRGTSSVTLRPERTVSALLPNDADLTQVVLDRRVFTTDLTAPVDQGQILGEVAVSFNGVDYGTVNLVANYKVELDRGAYMMTEIRSTLSNKYVRLGITLFAVILILYVAFIVYYNLRRYNKRRVAHELARRRVQEYQRSQEPSTGKSFEEIEARHAREMQETRKR